MAVKIKQFGDKPGARGGIVWMFHCPGCESGHPVEVGGDGWTWNGSIEAPTLRPSLLCNQHTPALRCHAVITDGKIQFLADCAHALKGKTVDIPDWEGL